MPRKSTKAASGADFDKKFIGLAAALGGSPLLEGEDRVAYDNLSAAIFDDIRPKDALEFIWAREIIDLTWEILRYRRHVSRFSQTGPQTGSRAP